MTQSVKRPTLDCGSGHKFHGSVGSSPTLSAQNPLGILSPPPFAPLPLTYLLSLKINKLKKI